MPKRLNKKNDTKVKSFLKEIKKCNWTKVKDSFPKNYDENKIQASYIPKHHKCQYQNGWMKLKNVFDKMKFSLILHWIMLYLCMLKHTFQPKEYLCSTFQEIEKVVLLNVVHNIKVNDQFLFLTNDKDYNGIYGIQKRLIMIPKSVKQSWIFACPFLYQIKVNRQLPFKLVYITKPVSFTNYVKHNQFVYCVVLYRVGSVDYWVSELNCKQYGNLLPKTKCYLCNLDFKIDGLLCAWKECFLCHLKSHYQYNGMNIVGCGACVQNVDNVVCVFQINPFLYIFSDVKRGTYFVNKLIWGVQSVFPFDQYSMTTLKMNLKLFRYDVSKIDQESLLNPEFKGTVDPIIDFNKNDEIDVSIISVVNPFWLNYEINIKEEFLLFQYQFNEEVKREVDRLNKVIAKLYITQLQFMEETDDILADDIINFFTENFDECDLKNEEIDTIIQKQEKLRDSFWWEFNNAKIDKKFKFLKLFANYKHKKEDYPVWKKLNEKLARYEQKANETNYHWNHKKGKRQPNNYYVLKKIPLTLHWFKLLCPTLYGYVKKILGCPKRNKIGLQINCLLNELPPHSDTKLYKDQIYIMQLRGSKEFSFGKRKSMYIYM